ncbi:MAG TPA: hypothetical protein VN800_06135, partial [Candidatus Acidoferrales bacterium]|nr:hypothetical protein [Candidatus Acidoferrales bacterium]
IAAGARGAGMPPDRAIAVPDHAAALRELRARLLPGDVVLLKASRGLGMDPGLRSRRGLGLDDLLGALEASTVGVPA